MALALQGQRRGLRDLAYSTIRDAIITLQIPPGERITEESLSEQLGVSRPVLRESLQRLQVEQLIDRLDNGRLRVRPVTTEDVMHLYSVRSALEQLAVREASERMTEKDRNRLAEQLVQLRRSATEPDRQAVTDSGTQFHHLLAQIAANPVNTHLMRQIQGPIDRLRHLSVTNSTRPSRSITEHENILAALTAHDTDAAAHAMHLHIIAGRDSVLHALETP